jgi:hypothetical protein
MTLPCNIERMFIYVEYDESTLRLAVSKTYVLTIQEQFNYD